MASKGGQDDILSAGVAVIIELVARCFAKLTGEYHMKTGVEQSRRSMYELTRGELRVLRLLVKGLKRREIAEELNLSLHTVDTHLANSYSKLRVHNDVAAVSKLLAEGVFLPIVIRPGLKIGEAEKSMDPSIALARCSM